MSGTETKTGPAIPGSATTARRHKKSHAAREILPHTRLTLRGRYKDFLQALRKHEGAKGFPTFFADTHFAATVGGYLSDVDAFEKAKIDRRQATSLQRAMLTQGNVIVDRGTAALDAFYGPEAATLADFGIRPKRPRGRKRHVVTPHAPPKSTTGGTSGGTTPAGSAA